MSKNAAFALWDGDRIKEFTAMSFNGRVGSVLVSETDAVRVWHLKLAPGARIGFHRHVLDYFWTVLCGGQARSHYGDGSIRDVIYQAGDTRHFTFTAGEHMTHDLENTGSGPLIFVTVEYKHGYNAPLDIA